MKKIKVMHFVSGLVSGGVEQMLCNYCGAMDKEKYDFIVVYQHDAVESCKEKIEEAGCKTIQITARCDGFIKNILESYKVIKDNKPDIVHAHMNLMNFCALLAAKLAGVGVRISHSHIAEKNRGTLFNMMASMCKFLCILFATNLMTCGDEAGVYLYGKKRMSNGSVELVENAIDMDYYNITNEDREKARTEHNLENKFVVGHIGRFSYQKNHERLIRIFYELKKTRTDALLLLVGTGELEEQIRDEVSKLGLENDVIFYGTTKSMREVYSLMDVFVLPSRFEGFPVVSVEVQAARINSVFSDTIAPTCKLTDLIEFVSLDESDDVWVSRILKCAKKDREVSLDKLLKQYSIKEREKMLDAYYMRGMAYDKD